MRQINQDLRYHTDQITIENFALENVDKEVHMLELFSTVYIGTDIDQTYVLLGSDNLENVALNSAKLKGGLPQVIDWSTT